MPEVTRPHPNSSGFQLWHGAQGWGDALEVRSCRKGSYEHGPGIYLTTKLDTAKHYARGAGCLVEFELAPTTRWLEDSHIEIAAAVGFLNDRSGLRHRAAIINDLNRNLERMQQRDPTTTKIWAPVLVNLCVNHEALTSDHGPALARFLVEQGIDASHANAKYDESWVVLFNPEVVTQQVRHRVATVDCFADFATIDKQQQALLDGSQAAPALASSPRRPRVR